jgi:hypothetical protein
MTVTFQEDVHVRGTLVPSAIQLPANVIDVDTKVKAGVNISADKTEQRLHPSWSQPNTTATAETRTLFVARRPGTINEVIAGSIVAATGDSTVTVDVRKNGTSILSSVITLDNANTARIVEAGAISGAGTYVAGDWIEAVIAVSAGTGTLPTGVFIQIECDQDGA